MKLGEHLVRKGIIDEEQLQKALDSQMIVGGHLGTCLIENGLVEERPLGETLAEIFETPYASRELFHNIPQFVVETLPLKLAVKHCVMPLRLDKKVLDVAMVDPKNLQAIDELSFASGYRIRPSSAPEFRIFQALERYYEVAQRQRYVALCRKLDPSDTGGHAEVDRLEKQWPVVASSESDELSDLLCNCETPEQLAATVLGRSAVGANRCILFKVVHSTAFLWRASGMEIDPVASTNLHFRIITEPIFALLRGEELYRGMLPHEPEYGEFYAKLKMRPPIELMILPVYLDDRLVAMFYVDGGPKGKIEGDSEETRRLVKKLGLALSLLVVRRQIRSA